MMLKKIRLVFVIAMAISSLQAKNVETVTEFNSVKEYIVPLWQNNRYSTKEIIEAGKIPKVFVEVKNSKSSHEVNQKLVLMKGNNYFYSPNLSNSVIVHNQLLNLMKKNLNRLPESIEKSRYKYIIELLKIDGDYKSEIPQWKIY